VLEPSYRDAEHVVDNLTSEDGALGIPQTSITTTRLQRPIRATHPPEGGSLRGARVAPGNRLRPRSQVYLASFADLLPRPT
jgi:hypothetical protein